MYRGNEELANKVKSDVYETVKSLYKDDGIQFFDQKLGWKKIKIPFVIEDSPATLELCTNIACSYIESLRREKSTEIGVSPFTVKLETYHHKPHLFVAVIRFRLSFTLLRWSASL